MTLEDIYVFAGVDETSLVKLLSQTQMLKSLCLRDAHLVDQALHCFSGSSLEMLDVSNTMVSHQIYGTWNLSLLEYMKVLFAYPFVKKLLDQ